MPKELGLEELRVLSEKATQGDWYPADYSTDIRVRGGRTIVGMTNPQGDGNGLNDRAFIVALVNAYRSGLLLPLSGKGKGMGAPPTGSGSHASHSTPSGSRRPGFDPSRIAEAIEIARDAGKALVGVGMFGTVPGALQNAFGELAVAGAKAAIEALGIEARQGRGEDAVGDESPADLSATPTLPLPPRGRCQGWEPIETAPKDGTEILGFGVYMGQPTRFVTQWNGAEWYAGWGTAIQPSLWQYLPTSPTPTEG